MVKKYCLETDKKKKHYTDNRHEVMYLKVSECLKLKCTIDSLKGACIGPPRLPVFCWSFFFFKGELCNLNHFVLLL